MFFLKHLYPLLGLLKLTIFCSRKTTLSLVRQIWWEDLLQTVKIRYNKQNTLTRFFKVPHGDEMRKTKKPMFLFGRRGQPLSADFARIQTRDREEFEKWMWKQIEVSVHFINNHHHEVELFWIHGRTAHSKGKLQPGETQWHTTMLTHEWW